MNETEIKRATLKDTDKHSTPSSPQALAQRLTNNALYLIAAYVIYFVSTIILVREAIRYLGADAYGVWAFASSLLALFLLFNLGIDIAVKKFLAEYKRKRKSEEIASILGTATIFFVCLVIPSSILLFGVLILFLPLSQLATTEIFLQFVLLLVFSFIIDFFSRLIGAIIEGVQNFKLVGIAKISSATVTLVLSLALLTMGFNLLSLPLGYLIGALIGLLVNLVYIVNKKLEIRFKVSKAWLAVLLQFGVSILIIRIGSQINLEWGKIVITLFLSLEQVTFYDIGNRLNWFIWVIPTMALPALLPASSELSIENNIVIRRIFLVGSKLVLTLSIFLFVFTFIMADQIIALWVGPAFSSTSALIFQILAVAFCTNIAIQVGITLLLGTNKKRVITHWTLFNAVLAVVLSLILTHFFGIIGVAFGISFSWTISNVALGIYCCMEFNIPKSQFMKICVLRQLFAVIVAIIPTILIRYFMGVGISNLILSFVLSSTIYFVLMLLMKVIEKRELALLRNFFTGRSI